MSRLATSYLFVLFTFCGGVRALLSNEFHVQTVQNGKHTWPIEILVYKIVLILKSSYSHLTSYLTSRYVIRD